MRNQLFAMGLLLITNTALNNDLQTMETCSIKQESECSGPLHPNDKSYTYSLGTQLDTESLLKKQLSLYQDLLEKLRKEPEFPLFVSVKVEKSYKEQVQSHLKRFLEKKENKDLSFLSKVNTKDVYKLVKALPEFRQNIIFNEVPLSRFDIAHESYTEKTFEQLSFQFPQAIKSNDVLREDQKALIVKHGVLAILVAQGFAKNVQLKS